LFERGVGSGLGRIGNPVIGHGPSASKYFKSKMAFYLFYFKYQKENMRLMGDDVSPRD
jgi:hypothetical protein